MNYDNQREPTPEEYGRKLAAMKRDQEKLADMAVSGAGQVDTASQYGLIKGANRIMDKRIVQSVLHQKASELRAQADGLERLAELVGAAANHDMTLFSAVLTLIDRR